MKSLTDLLTILLREAGKKCGTDTTRDIEYVARRVKEEGDSFITITLPSFSDDFDIAIEEGCIGSNTFRSFRKVESIPAFLQGMTSQVFDKTSGCLLDNPRIEAVRCIRQVCRIAKKVLVPCRKERNNASIQRYIKNEVHLGAIQELLGSALRSNRDEFVTFSRRVLTVALGKELYPGGKPGQRDSDLQFLRRYEGHWSGHDTALESRTVRDDILSLCGHGPGVVVEGLRSNQKYDWSEERYNRRLHGFFPFWEAVYGSLSICDSNTNLYPDGCTQAEEVDIPETELTVKVTLVPKTLKGPRIIAIEPVAMQYAQQGIMRYITRVIENKPSLFKGRVNFSDQSINGRLALQSSADKRLATLDLSDASDLVLNSLVDDILSCIPEFRDMVMACRSHKALLPTGDVVTLKKFASMGSALCFPIESIFFFTLILYGIAKHRKQPLLSCRLADLAKDVYVYGDDMILPVDEVPTVIHTLETFGLKVNRNKSFSKGNFRESCGVDAFCGEDITPVYLRRPLPNGSRDSRQLVSAVMCSNQLYKKGWYMTALAIEEHVQSLRRFQYVSERASSVGFVRDFCTKQARWNKDLQCGEIYTWVLVPRKQVDLIDGFPALVKWFKSKRDEPPGWAKATAQLDYVSSVGRGDLTLKRRWTQV